MRVWVVFNARLRFGVLTMQNEFGFGSAKFNADLKVRFSLSFISNSCMLSKHCGILYKIVSGINLDLNCRMVFHLCDTLNITIEVTGLWQIHCNYLPFLQTIITFKSIWYKANNWCELSFSHQIVFVWYQLIHLWYSCNMQCTCQKRL